jgi:hypothetical protein
VFYGATAVVYQEIATYSPQEQTHPQHVQNGLNNYNSNANKQYHHALKCSRTVAQSHSRTVAQSHTASLRKTQKPAAIIHHDFELNKDDK